jgi:hypothetical protein
MRHHARVYVLAAAMFAAACTSDESNQAPTGPSVGPAPTIEPALAQQCRQDGLIVLQLTQILPPGPPLRLLPQALAKYALVQTALLTRKPDLAKTRALDLIDFITQNRNNLINASSPATLTKLANVIDAILCVVGLPPTGVTDPQHSGIGVVPGNNPNPVIITTPQGDAGLLAPIGSTPTTVVVTVTNGVSGGLNTPLDQYGQTIELTASQDVTWGNGGVTVALCVSADIGQALFDRLRVGHEGGDPANKLGNIEILPVAPQTAGNVAQILGGSCSSGFGSRGGFQSLTDLAAKVLLPDPLYALTAVATVGGKGGQATKFSKFRAVDPQLDVVPNPALPASTDGLTGAAVAQPPSVLVRTDSMHPVPGILIKFKVTGGTGSINPADPASVTTGSNGVATASSWTLGSGSNEATATAVSPVPASVNELTFTPPGSVTFTAQGAPAAPDFGASGWSFLVQSSAPDGNEWTTLPWPVTAVGWSQETAPFGSVGLNGTSPSGCSDKAPTEWPVNSTILMRRDFFVPAGVTTATISVKVDNDIRVFLNGAAVTNLVSHEGCAEVHPPGPFTATVVGGAVNRLAILGVDRGTESFIDVKVTFP